MMTGILFKTNIKNTRHCLGFTLTELAIVLSIIAIVLAAIFTTAGVVRNKARANDALNELNIISQNMVAFGASGYTSAPDTFITPALISANVIPDWAVSSISAGWGTNPWNPTSGLGVWWSPSTVPASFPNVSKYFRVSFYGVDTAGSCATLILNGTICTTPNQSGCVLAVYTNLATNKLLASNITSGTAQNLCQANTYGGANNSVEFDVSM